MRSDPVQRKTPIPLATVPTQRLVDDSDHTIALWGDVVIVIWRNEMQIAALYTLGTLLTDLAPKARSGQLGRFVVVERQAPRPSTEAREELVRMSRRCPLAFTAYVFEGDGFEAAAVRGIVTGIKLRTQKSLSVQLHASVGDAARWVGKVHSAYAAAPALEAAVRELR